MRRLLLFGLLTLAACATDAAPNATPYPTTAPTPAADAAAELARDYLDAWSAGDYPAMHALLAPADRERYPLEAFAGLHGAFAEMVGVSGLETVAGEPQQGSIAPEPRPPDLPAPTATPVPTPDPSASAAPDTSTPAGSEPAPFDPNAPVEGPVPATSVPVDLAFATQVFGDVELERQLTMTDGADGWQVRWTPALLFPELGTEGTLEIARDLAPRGRIVAADGTVFAENSPDGVRRYPQDALAGSAIGYVSEVTAEDLEALAATGYRPGDVVGRSGLEAGAETLLRGSPGVELVAVAPDGERTTLLEREMVPGADLTITLRAELQRTAEAALAAYPEAGTAVIDPASGDVWVLASTPAFNPNSAALGAGTDGMPLPPPEFAQVLNKAILGAYPAGSSFKPFTLAAALQAGTATPATGVTCPSTWQFSPDFVAHNYEDHSLPGTVSLIEAMAFSCNTTYMPLALELYQSDPSALTDLLAEFGFGQPTGIRYMVEETGILPDDAWLTEQQGVSYTPFDQVQMAIGQGFLLVTPLQQANAYAAIGNGGTVWVPRIVISATQPDGTVVEEIEPTVARRLTIDAADLAYVTESLEAVVTLPYGTGTAAFAGFGLQVAGKSGTAETGGEAPHAWFPAFAPAEAPTISVATVLLHVPLATGGSDAAPLVRQVMATHLGAP
jgi:cell division protein FtsI/penicillin-binding protein 2